MQHHTETAPTDHFPTDATGLPEARASELVELSDGDSSRSADRSGRQATGRRDGPDAGLQRVDPRTDLEGAGGLGGHRRRREPGRHGRHGSLAWAAAGEPLRRNARDAARRWRWARGSPRASRSPIRGCTGTTRISARTTGRRWACTATCSSSRPTRTTGRPCTVSWCSRSTTSCWRTARLRRSAAPRRPTRRWAASATCCWSAVSRISR